MTFTAYLQENHNVSVKFETKPVLDHIVTAFFRLDPKKDKYTKLSVEEKLEGDKFWGLVSIPDLFHHQGLYREGDCFYISVSTSPTHPAYIYKATEGGGKTNKGEQKETEIVTNQGIIHLDRNNLMKKYTHPGGIQVAKNVLAVGMEKYFGPFPVSAGNDSLIRFFDPSNGDEYTDLKINQLAGEKKKVASALAIVEAKGKYTVANRTSKQAVDLFQIDNLYPISKPTPYISFDNVGEFQNMNLFIDEKEEMYLFGMGVQGCKRKLIYGYLVYEKGSYFDNTPTNSKINEEIDFHGHGDYNINPTASTNKSSFQEPRYSSGRYKLSDETGKPRFVVLPKEDIVDIPILTKWHVDPNDYSFLHGHCHLVEAFSGKEFVYGSGRNKNRVVVYKFPLSAIVEHGEDSCYIYKINRSEKLHKLEATWIDEQTGQIVTKPYTEERVKNSLVFSFKNNKASMSPSFVWASCLYLEEVKAPKKGNKLLKEKEEKLFKSKFTLYSVAKGVKNKTINTAYFEERKE